MTLLAIDTAGELASVALFDGRGVLAEATWLAPRHQDDRLFPEIERQLSLAGVTVEDIRRVAVTVGPGSFTGLRVAVAAAQGIARASGALAIGVPTADVAAWPFAGAGSRVCVLIPAGRGEHYAAMYRERAGRWSCVSPLTPVTIDAIERDLVADTIFAGPFDGATADRLRERLGPRAHVPPASARIRRAGHLAEVAWSRAEAGLAVAPERLEPLYVRPPLIRGAASSGREGP